MPPCLNLCAHIEVCVLVKLLTSTGNNRLLLASRLTIYFLVTMVKVTNLGLMLTIVSKRSGRLICIAYALCVDNGRVCKWKY